MGPAHHTQVALVLLAWRRLPAAPLPDRHPRFRARSSPCCTGRAARRTAPCWTMARCSGCVARAKVLGDAPVASVEAQVDGSDRDRVGAWLEKGILDTQLGPNRNGKKW